MRLSIGSFVCSVVGAFGHYNAEYTDGSSFLSAVFLEKSIVLKWLATTSNP
jgi:hypothetical protein